MNAILLIIGVWLIMLVLILRQELAFYREIKDTAEDNSLGIGTDHENIYLRHEAYNRYEGTDYRGDKP